MYRSRDHGALGAGVISKSWQVRAATVLAIGTAGASFGFFQGHLLVGLLGGIVLGVASVVMGESSMQTGAYRYPEKHF